MRPTIATETFYTSPYTRNFNNPKKKKTIKVIYSNVRSNSILYIKNKVNTLCGSKITGLVSTNTKIVKRVI